MDPGSPHRGTKGKGGLEFRLTGCLQIKTLIQNLSSRFEEAVGMVQSNALKLDLAEQGAFLLAQCHGGVKPAK